MKRLLNSTKLYENSLSTVTNEIENIITVADIVKKGTSYNNK